MRATPLRARLTGLLGEYTGRQIQEVLSNLSYGQYLSFREAEGPSRLRPQPNLGNLGFLFVYVQLTINQACTEQNSREARGVSNYKREGRSRKELDRNTRASRRTIFSLSQVGTERKKGTLGESKNRQKQGSGVKKRKMWSDLRS